MSRIFSIMLLAFSVIGCTKTIELDLDGTDSLLVVNSFYTPDSAWSFEITPLLFPLQDLDTTPLSQVQIRIWENNQAITLQVTQEGNHFQTNFFPKTDAEYVVEVEAPGYPLVTAHTQLLPKAPMLEIALDTTAWYQEDGFFYYRAHSNLLDLDTKGEGYQFRLEATGDYLNQTPNGIDTLKNQRYGVSIGVRFPFQLDQVFGAEFYGLVYEDVIFNGEEIPVEIRIPKATWEFRRHARLRLDFRQLSPEYVQFAKSINTQDGTVTNPYVQPAQVFSNVDGGVGIIAGFHRQWISLE